ncbi:uncharacterized protein MYCGRDRAFT_97709 [Zymoseptoria tritici IPO323]|uniref:Uncharacterized protein n=1 Tax=Zymoseptoria tritici (strain CBS 115943 / IPO323) TaxID=336722 RepID=F9XR47_ZYMTI|nr:uncharacterized protein MYCGRDRAFT_97709 [Zymoseptoria tritici IPO323]EGP82276.1 hypothetical protein MYCGRDRAFT_97709 [Zymoseptoria tritici IPO323]
MDNVDIGFGKQNVIELGDVGLNISFEKQSVVDLRDVGLNISFGKQHAIELKRPSSRPAFGIFTQAWSEPDRLRDLGAEGRTIKERFGNENTQLQDWHEEKLQSHESGLENVFEVKPESHMDQVTRWITNLARPTSRRAERRMNNHEKSGGEDCAAIHQHRYNTLDQQDAEWSRAP